jgi:hypothetical protein
LQYFKVFSKGYLKDKLLLKGLCVQEDYLKIVSGNLIFKKHQLSILLKVLQLEQKANEVAQVLDFGFESFTLKKLKLFKYCCILRVLKQRSLNLLYLRRCFIFGRLRSGNRCLTSLL